MKLVLKNICKKFGNKIALKNFSIEVKDGIKRELEVAEPTGKDIFLHVRVKEGRLIDVRTHS